ncbi:MAG: accessory factor UbiK family protein [Porticoccaceae bacterium]|nr:accessory factor UbiK family protein [Porticoccaceae bacterium]
MNQDNSDNLVNQFIKQFNQAFVPGAQALGDEVQMQMRSAMTSALQKMNLVTREEFDTQQAVLRRSREKLDNLEQQIAELEETLRQLNDK